MVTWVEDNQMEKDKLRGITLKVSDESLKSADRSHVNSCFCVTVFQLNSCCITEDADS